MKRKPSVVILTVILVASAAVLSFVAYASETISGQASITIVGSEFSSQPPSPPPTPPPQPDSPSPSGRGGGADTTTITDAQAPLGDTVTILDPNTPLAELPVLPQTGGNRATATLATILLTGGVSIILLAGRRGLKAVR